MEKVFLVVSMTIRAVPGEDEGPEEAYERKDKERTKDTSSFL